MDDEALRVRMVEEQITSRGVADARVLSAMRAVPRHRFVPEVDRDHAYEDRPLPIGEGQTISQPYMVAVMSAALDVRAGDHVLEIGTGSGYQTAVLSHLAARVISVERHAPLAARAAALLRELEIRNVEVVVGDGTAGWSARAPYDRILVTAGAPAVPESLVSQLSRGGRLVIPVGPSGFQRLTVIDRTVSGVTSREGEACVFVPLIGEHGWPEKG